MVVMLEDKAAWDKAMQEAGDKLVVVDFTATWCGPCKMIGPKFVEMEKEFPDAIFYKVDVDENSDVAGAEGISAMPTFKCYRNGKQVADMCGANETKLREMIKEQNGKK
ncbi:thioredoxin-like [Mya arenaria]|uniref:thioredoxin-like n=1 Tax=Mya arenaria TaxID=6604 RepID=UPI0022E472B6|nr:thioredoxin-like [Mya arenaria]